MNSPRNPDDRGLTQIRVGIVSKTFFYVPLWLGIEQGVFAKHGLDVKLSILGNASQVEPLLQGDLDFAIATPESIMQNVSDDGPLRIIAGNTGKLSHSLITRKPFKKIDDLRGATLGVLNLSEGSFFQMQELMAHHGLHYPDDYFVKEMGGVPPRHHALLSGEIDAGLQSIPWNYVAEDEGLNNLGEITQYVPDWQFVSINTNLDWAKANEDTTVRFLSALLKSTAIVYRDETTASAVASRELPTSLPYAKRAWQYYTSTNTLTEDLSINHAGLRKILDTQIKAGFINAKASMNPDTYIEPSFLSQAWQLGQKD